jgi:hypothetical protein
MQPEPGAAKPRKDCPNCGAAVDPQSVICQQCGFDWRSGKLHGGASSGTKLVWIAGGIMLLVVIAVGYVFLSPRPGTQEAADTERTDAVVGAEPLATPEDEAEDKETEPAVEQMQAKDVDVAEQPGFTEENRQHLEQYRDQLAVRLERQYPLYERDQEVVLRQGNGRIRRGRYLGNKGDVLVLVEGHSTAEIPLASLDRDTRLRCDEKFRAAFVRSHLRRRIARLQRAKAAAAAREQEQQESEAEAETEQR